MDKMDAPPVFLESREPPPDGPIEPKPLNTSHGPWDPRTWCIGLAIFFGFGAAGVLAGVNWRALGKPKWVWPTIVLSIVGEVGLVALVSVLKSTIAKEVGYLINLGIGYLLFRLQKPVYEAFINEYGLREAKKPGWVLPIGIGIGSIATVLAVASTILLLQNAAVQRHLDQGTTYLGQGHYDQAIAEFDAMIKIDPREPHSYIGRGLVYMYESKFDQSLANFNQAIQLDATIAVAYRDRGLAYYFSGGYDTALADMEKAIEIDPKAAQSYLGRGLVFEKKGSKDNAIADFTKALALSQDPFRILA